MHKHLNLRDENSNEFLIADDTSELIDKDQWVQVLFICMHTYFNLKCESLSFTRIASHVFVFKYCFYKKISHIQIEPIQMQFEYFKSLHKRNLISIIFSHPSEEYIHVCVVQLQIDYLIYFKTVSACIKTYLKLVI